MIKQCFQFLPGVGPTLEQKWLEKGLNWDSFRREDSVSGLSPTKHRRACKLVDKAEKNLLVGNSKFFLNVLPTNEYWRLYEHFKDETCFLDIETTGLAHWDKITMVGLTDGLDTKIMIRDINMDMKAIKAEMNKYKLLVTFNGKSFDVPFIEKRHPNTVPNIPHIDLRHLCAKCGYHGGLKRIEKEFGIKRGNEVGDLDGSDAVRLWKQYKKSGDRKYLDILAEYNEEDILNLKPILERCVRELKGN